MSAETIERAAVSIERDGAVAAIVLCRPHRRNALDLDAWIALREAVLELQEDPQIRSVILTGADGTFCAGSDLDKRGSSHPLDRMRVINATAIALSEFPKPLVAKVDGFAVGAGWNMALLCDFVVAAKGAKFSQIFAKRGLSVDFGGSWILPRLVGLQQAKRLVMLAETIDAQEAYELGLVTYLVEPAELDEHTSTLAQRLAAGPPAALSQSAAMLEHHTLPLVAGGVGQRGEGASGQFCDGCHRRGSCLCGKAGADLHRRVGRTRGNSGGVSDGSLVV